MQCQKTLILTSSNVYLLLVYINKLCKLVNKMLTLAKFAAHLLYFHFKVVKFDTKIKGVNPGFAFTVDLKPSIVKFVSHLHLCKSKISSSALFSLS